MGNTIAADLTGSDEGDFGVRTERETIQLPTMSIRELFEFVTNFDLKDEDVDEHLRTVMDKVAARGPNNDVSNEDQVDEQVFMQQWLPRCLDELGAPNVEQSLIDNGEVEDIYLQTVKGMVPSIG